MSEGDAASSLDLAARLVRAIAECRKAQNLLGEDGAASPLSGARVQGTPDGRGPSSLCQENTSQENDDCDVEQDVHEAWACLERARALLEGHCPPGSAAAKRHLFVSHEIARMGKWLRSDPYTALACAEGDSTAMIKKAYRRLIRRYHPDKSSRHTDTRELFLIIQEAYEVLVDSQRRKAYDAKIREENFHRNSSDKTSPSPKRDHRRASSASTSRKIRELSKLPTVDLETRVRVVRERLDLLNTTSASQRTADFEQRQHLCRTEIKLVKMLLRQRHRTEPVSSSKESTSSKADTKIGRLKRIHQAHLLSEIGGVDSLDVRQLLACLKTLTEDSLNTPDRESSGVPAQRFYGMERGDLIVTLKTSLLDAMAPENVRQTASQLTSLRPDEIQKMGIAALRKICATRIARGQGSSNDTGCKALDPDESLGQTSTKESSESSSNGYKTSLGGSKTVNMRKGSQEEKISAAFASTSSATDALKQMRLLGKAGRRDVQGLFEGDESRKPDEPALQTTANELDKEATPVADDGTPVEPTSKFLKAADDLGDTHGNVVDNEVGSFPSTGLFWGIESSDVSNGDEQQCSAAGSTADREFRGSSEHESPITPGYRTEDTQSLDADDVGSEIDEESDLPLNTSVPSTSRASFEEDDLGSIEDAIGHSSSLSHSATGDTSEDDDDAPESRSATPSSAGVSSGLFWGDRAP